ncbi:MAG TPA: ABC transporter substrate-binding protein [Acetobacteraceae bacterium]|nr:ABC transporter substrate-binding protein [Acetobacteraceae bacterium]
MRLAALAIACLLLSPGALAQEEPDDTPATVLRGGVAENDPPFVMREPGGPAGFTIDLFTAIAHRLHRAILFLPVKPTALEHGLAAEQFDFLPGPITADPEGAHTMLFTDGYMWNALRFATARGAPPVQAPEDLARRLVAVREGGEEQQWAARNRAQYGFRLRGYPNTEAALAAVLSGHADALLSGDTALRYLARQHPDLVPGLTLDETRAQYAAAFRKTDGGLRERVEDALDCLKRNGTVAALSEKWFGARPDDDALERIMEPGYGVPGLAGYDPEPHKTRC